MNADGSGQTRLTNRAGSDTSPAYSPDGSKIAFERASAGGPTAEIYTMNADGTGETQVTNNATNDADPDWQPAPRPRR